MKLVMALCVLALIVSCTQKKPKYEFACSIAQTATKVASDSFAGRWGCDSDKLYNFLASKLDDNICKTKSNLIGQTMCPVVVDALVLIGKEKLSSDFDCNIDKIQQDMEQISKVCEQLKF